MSTSKIYWAVAAAVALTGLTGCDDNDRRDPNYMYPQPSITAIMGSTVDEDTVVGPLAFTVSDPTTPAANLVVTANSNSPAVCPQNRIALGGTGGSRTITVTPADDAVGTCDIVVSVRDSDGYVASTQLGLTFREVRVNYTARSRMQFGVAATGTPAELNREKFDFPDNEDNMFLVYQDLVQ